MEILLKIKERSLLKDLKSLNSKFLLPLMLLQEDLISQMSIWSSKLSLQKIPRLTSIDQEELQELVKQVLASLSGQSNINTNCKQLNTRVVSNSHQLESLNH